MNQYSYFVRAIVLMLLVWLVVSPAAAQETINYGAIAVRVVDASGAPLPGVEIAVTQQETTAVERSVTDVQGRARFQYLRYGRYQVRSTLQKYQPAIQVVNVTAGSAFDLTLTMQLGFTESVTASAPVLEAARSQVAGSVSLNEVKALPLNGRNILDLALLVPGVSSTNIGGGTQLFPETSAVPGVGLSVGSQRNLSNNFMVDGLSANDDAAALSGISYGVDAIDQFQVVTGGGNAELGRALGGYINISTRSGTNIWQGSAYAFFRDDTLNARNALTGTRLPMHQNQYGGSVGGPIRKEQTFFFANVEQRLLDQSGVVSIAPGVVNLINARLDAVGYQGPPVTTGIYPNPVDTLHLTGKIDRHVSASQHWSVRYSLYDVRSDNARGAGGTASPSASTGVDNLDQTIAVSNVMTLSPNTLLETRGQLAHSDLLALPSDPIGPAVSIAGVASFGTLSTSPTGRVNRMVQVVSNVTHQTSAHSIRGGVDVIHNDLAITFPRAVRGSYSFASLAAFLNGTYNNAGFTQTFGAIDVDQTNPNVGVYVQDEWRWRSNLTLNAGVRYDLQFLETIDTDRDNWSPRLGLVWTPATRWLVRANAGRFFDRLPLRALANALLSAGNTTDVTLLRQSAVSLSPAQTGAPVFPSILQVAVPPTSLVNLTTMDRQIQNAHSDQGSIEVERQLTDHLTVSVTYQHLKGRQLIMQINQNVPSCAVSGNNNGCRPISTYANNNQYRSAGSSVYDGLHVSIVKRLSGWGTYRVSYGLSKSMNNVGEAFFNGPIDPFDLSKDWARSDDDQRHRLLVSGVVNVLGFQTSGAFQYLSALPYNITTGANTIQGTPARPVVNGEFIPRNDGEGSTLSTVNLRVARTFKLRGRSELEALVEAFNLFDRRNDVARTTVFGTGAYPTNPSPAYGTVTVVGEPRLVQLGFRVRF